MKQTGRNPAIMAMEKEGLELAISNSGADRSGYVDELGVCGSDSIGICLVRSSMVMTADKTIAWLM